MRVSVMILLACCWVLTPVRGMAQPTVTAVITAFYPDGAASMPLIDNKTGGGYRRVQVVWRLDEGARECGALR